MRCKQCDNEFEAKRSDAQYCSPKCRKVVSRIISVTHKPVTDKVIVTDNRKEIKSFKRPFDLCKKHKIYFFSCGC